jgi:hypothetical protein
MKTDEISITLFRALAKAWQPSKNLIKRWTWGLEPRDSQPVKRRHGSAIDQAAINIRAANLERNQTAPGYHKRCLNLKELRRRARKMLKASQGRQHAMAAAA